MKQILLNLLKLAISLGLLYFLYTRLHNSGELWRSVVDANKLLLALATITYAAAVALSGLKWGVLLRAAGVAVTTGRLLAYQWMAEFFNAFLPAQVGGDIMRGYALAADTHRVADAAASILIDRFIGLTVFMLGAAVAAVSMLLLGRPDGMPFTREQTVGVQLIAVGSCAASALLIGVLIVMLSRRLKALAERVLARLPLAERSVPMWQKLAAAFNVYRHTPGALLWCAAGSALIVVLTSVVIWLIAEALAPGSITLIEVLAINPIIVFVALALPLSPGGLGVRQGAFAATFWLMGAGAGLGFAVGLIQQAISYLVSLPGAVLWIKGRGARTPTQPSAVSDPS